MKIPRTVRNTAISVFALIILFLASGIVYVFYSGKQQPAKPAATKKSSTQGLPKPVKPAANASEGVALENVTSPVKAGDNSSMMIRTLPTSKCTVVVDYSNNTASHDSGLAPKTADAYGFITWSWTVEPTVPAGTGHATATCVYNGRSGVAVGNFQVTAD